MPNPPPPAITAVPHIEGDQVDAVRFRVDTSLYTPDAIFRACYQFTDRCYLFLEGSGDEAIIVECRKRMPSSDLQDIVGAFANELINQRVRADIARETQTIRELIVARAFAEADFRDPTQ